MNEVGTDPLVADALREHGYHEVVHVGAGGLGDVYRALRGSTGGPVAIKVVREHGDREATDRRVRRELDALLKLKGHPNVVQIEELIPLPTGLALVMEFVSGGSLMDLVQTDGPLGPAQAVSAMADVTRALGDAHALGIVHRDIKPHNVMVGQFGQCKVCDFGIAAVLKDTGFTDRTSSLSYRYASPEELDDAPDIGPATDVYSLGVSLRQLLTGESSEVRAQPMADHLALDRRFSEVERKTVSVIMQLVASMTERDSANRPTAAQVLTSVRDLERWLGPARVTSVKPRVVENFPIADTDPRSSRSAATPEAGPVADIDDTVVRPQKPLPPPTAPAPPGDPRRVLPNPNTTPQQWWEKT